MPRLYQITIPGLSLKADFTAARRRLIVDFPQVMEVLRTTIPATVLVAYVGEDEVDAWLAALSDCVAARRMGLPRSDAVNAKNASSVG
jgi:hypothetical protein